VLASVKDTPKPAFDVVKDLLGDAYSPQMAAWGLQVTLAHLDHLAIQGEVSSEEDGDQKLWRAAGS
jgi:hypothetical protein